jgi:cell division protein FtsL
MSEIAGGVILGGKAIDNSRVVREVDPRSHRDLFVLLAVVGLVVLGLVLYAWPHLAMREAHRDTERLSRDRERLVEEQRKLRLEKAALENLRRVESIATRELGMSAPAPERLIVVERGTPVDDAARVASRGPAAPAHPEPSGTPPPR